LRASWSRLRWHAELDLRTLKVTLEKEKGTFMILEIMNVPFLHSKVFIRLMVDRAIAIGYTAFSPTWRRHFTATRGGLDANSL
jgi:hypothetical protein